MKYLFYVWCFFHRANLDTARGVWFVYHERRKSAGFKRYIGASILSVNPFALLLISPIFDFLKDEGVYYVLEQLGYRKPPVKPLNELGIFTRDFTRNIGRYYLKGDGINAYISIEDFANLRKLYLRNLIHVIEPQGDPVVEDDIWKMLVEFQHTPELTV